MLPYWKKTLGRWFLRNVHWPLSSCGMSSEQRSYPPSPKQWQKKRKTASTEREGPEWGGGGDVQTIQRRSSRPMFREKRSGMCLRSTFWLSFEAMLEMALLVMSPYFSLCYVRVLTCVWKAKWCVREAMSVCMGKCTCCCVFFLCSEGEVFGKPLLFQLLSPPLLQIRAPTKKKLAFSWKNLFCHWKRYSFILKCLQTNGMEAIALLFCGTLNKITFITVSLIFSNYFTTQT